MSEAKRRFSTFEEGYQFLREKYHNFKVGSPELQALCDLNDRENFHREQDNAVQLLAKMKKTIPRKLKFKLLSRPN